MRRDICFGAKAVPQMNWGKPQAEKLKPQFRGSLLVATLLEQFPYRFRGRASAVRFSKRLFREGKLQSIFNFPTFEDSEQLYVWQNEDVFRNQGMTSSRRDRSRSKEEATEDNKIVAVVKSKLTEKAPNVSLINNFFKEFEEDFPEATYGDSGSKTDHYHTPWSTQRGSTASSESSVDTATQGYSKYRDKLSGGKTYYPYTMTSPGRDHDVIQEEDAGIARTEGNSLEIEMEPENTRTLSSHMNPIEDLVDPATRRWHDSHYSYSDNEKQLIEEMKRMKKEHQHITKTYEERINKLMAKMHELRSIAEMLENSSTKSSPYGILPAKTSLLNFIGANLELERKQGVSTYGPGIDVPPPLPPRPGRGNKVYPNKPIVHPRVRMKPLQWTRLILRDEGSENSLTSIWQTMLEPKIDTEELERLFKMLEGGKTNVVSLYDDIMQRRGRPKQQLINIFEGEKCRRIIYTMKSLPCSLSDILSSITTLDTSSINSDRFAELLELCGTGNEMEKILTHARRKGTETLDNPEFLVVELSKLDGFKEKLDFTRFRFRIQWHLFEIEQQLRELHTACDEITNSIALKNLLETLLAVGNYLNGGSENGQADGYNLDILNRLKEIQDWDGKGNLLEFVLKLYCQFYEPEIDIVCPTRFRLPEPSNMRHAAQVSLDSVEDVLSNLQTDVQTRREKLLEKYKGDNQLLDTIRTTAENFFTSVMEVINEEEKLLQDTREIFKRTKSYFLYDNRDCNPQQFFQLWATFLHDCKYYWKLAHRKIAKERFEQEFKYKGQMSASSMHGYETFRASMLRRLTTIRGIPDEKSTQTQNASVKQINSWIDSVEQIAKETPSVPPLPVKDTKSAKLEAEYQQRSASPKRLTSEPPSTGILHKPQPKTPSVNGVVNLPQQNGQGNYENQEEFEKGAFGSRDDLSHLKEVDNKYSVNNTNSNAISHQSKSSEKQPQFFLKSLLKRDTTKRNNSGESKTSSESQTTDTETTRRPSNNTFSKLRNSVVQKFSNSGSKRSPQNLQLPVKEEPPTPQLDTPSYMPVTLQENEIINPYETSYGRESRVQPSVQTNGDRGEHQSARYPTDLYNSYSDRRYRQHENNYFSPRTPGKSRNDSDISTEYAALYHTPPFTSGVTLEKDAYASPNVVMPFPKSDINNNEKRGSDVGERHGASRQRAPIALGSNISISDAYRREDSENTPNRYIPHSSEHRSTKDRNMDFPMSPTDVKRTFGNPVPTYKAKIVHNYENQGKLEPARAIKQTAEPVSFNSNKMDTPTHVNRDRHGDYLSDDSTEVKHPFESQNRVENTDLKSSNKTQQGNVSLQDRQPYSSQFTPDTFEKQNLGRTPVTSQSGQIKSFSTGKKMSIPNKDNMRFALSRGPASSHQTISNLIERFEKKQPTEQFMNEYTESKNTPQSKSLAVTSTPVTPRRPVNLPIQTKENPPLVPPRVDQTPESLRHHPSEPPHSQSSATSTPQHDSKLSSSRTRYNPKIPPPKPPHTREFSNASSNDDAYKDSLRKAASSSVFDRYKMSPMSPSVPHYSRQSSQNSQTYPLRLHENFSPDVNSSPNQQTQSRFNYQDKDQPSNTQYNRQGHSSNTQGQGQIGSTAVVKPTIVHQGNVTFMEF